MDVRYYADIFDADGKWYVFDEVDSGSECAGPFITEGEARQTANDLNTDNTAAQGLRPHMIQRSLSGFEIKTLSDAVEMALALMKDDPANFKRGYSKENACLAVQSVSGFRAAEIATEMELQWLKQRGRL